MDLSFEITNKTSELSDCAAAWFYSEKHRCWCLEDILYTQKATTPKFQRLSIYVPEEYMKAGGKINETGKRGKFSAKTAPVVFLNSSAGYMQMPNSWLDGPNDEGSTFLERGMIYVTCGCRGRESRDADGNLCAKSPQTLVDLKCAIRFLRHNSSVLPGNFERIISVGMSAGGAMSSLLGVTGNCMDYNEFLEEDGAFMNERDDVYAAMIYCPVTDLEHADLAYEWQFANDMDYEASMAAPAGTLTAFEAALSEKLAGRYISYFNSLDFKDPETGASLTLNPDGRSGSGYDYLMKILEESAQKYLSMLEAGQLSEIFSVKDYINGQYTYKMEQMWPDDGKKDDLGLHHTGGAAVLPADFSGSDFAPSFSLGDLMCHPPKGMPYTPVEFPVIDVKGDDKQSWLSWDGKTAKITGLDDYLSGHRRRMKPCTAFDALDMNTGENQEFGTAENDYVHFSSEIAPAIEALKDDFPEEYAKYYPLFEKVSGDKELANRRALINPMNYIGSPDCFSASHFRIRTGAQDADTAFTVSMALALKLAETGEDTDYALVWDKPHCMADYPGQLCEWIEDIV